MPWLTRNRQVQCSKQERVFAQFPQRLVGQGIPLSADVNYDCEAYCVTVLIHINRAVLLARMTG